MQAEVTILARVTHSYVAHRGIRLVCVLAVVAASLLLFLLGGGFPPWAWRTLAQVLPQTSVLLAARGSSVLLALGGLILIAGSILLTWLTIFWLAWRMLAYWWYEYRARQDFAQAIAEAQEIEYRSASMQRNTASRRPMYTPAQGWDEDGEAEDKDYQEDDSIEMYQDEEDSSEDEEIDPYQDEREAQADQIPIEDEGEESNDVQYEPATAEDAEALWEIPTQPVSSPSPQRTRLASPVAYEQTIVEHAHTIAQAQQQANNLRYSSYGRFLPAASTSTLQTPQRRTLLAALESMPTAPLTPVPPAAPLTPVPPVNPPAAIQLVVSTGLDVGLKRKGKPNEDSLLALQNTRILRGRSCPVGLFVIADGMGGHENGQEASRLVIQSLSRTVVPSIIYGPTDDNYAELLAEGVHHANLAVFQRNREANADMGTTIAAALVVNTTAYIANVGDSRVYLYRVASGLTQITRDHSTVARLVESGLIKPEDIYTHPRRNEIYRSLGRHPSEDIDDFILALQPDDLLILCSDGLWEMVRDTQIQQIIESLLEYPTHISTALVQAALDGGGKDNISVIAVCIKPPAEHAIYRVS